MDTDTLIPPTALDYTRESIKLCRNSKGHTWEIKIIGTGTNGILTKEDIERQSKLNDVYETNYGRTE